MPSLRQSLLQMVDNKHICALLIIIIIIITPFLVGLQALPSYV